MLTTTIDGLWILQILTGLETLAPELGLRPHLPSVETRQMALDHPIAAELRAAGVIDDDGYVDDIVTEWLTVLARRDTSLLIYAQIPAGDRDPERVLLARFAQWWVALERCGVGVRISGAGTAGSEQAAVAIIESQIGRLCGELAPAPMRPVTLPVEELLANVRDRASLRRFLTDQHLDGDQIAMLTTAADPESSAQASVVAIQAGVEGMPARSHIESGAVTVIDTERGRLVCEHVRQSGTRWMIVSPGTLSNIAVAVQTMLRRLPSDEDWHSYRKVV